MAFRLSEGDLVRYNEIMERVSLGRMLEFVEMIGLEQTLHPKRKRKKDVPNAR